MWISQGQRTQGGVKRESYLELVFEADFLLSTMVFITIFHHQFGENNGIFSFVFSKHQIFAKI